jgi:hypothetical protein
MGGGMNLFPYGDFIRSVMFPDGEFGDDLTVRSPSIIVPGGSITDLPPGLVSGDGIGVKARKISAEIFWDSWISEAVGGGNHSLAYASSSETDDREPETLVSLSTPDPFDDQLPITSAPIPTDGLLTDGTLISIDSGLLITAIEGDFGDQ